MVARRGPVGKGISPFAAPPDPGIVKPMRFRIPFILFALLTAFVLNGCYVLKQGATLLDYQHRAVSIDSMLEDKNLPPETRNFLEQVKEIKLFAVRELGLAENDNYTKYVDLDRDYLAVVVSATEKDSFKRHEWWFPVVGKVPYKGFFQEEGAREEAEDLKRQDLDVWVRKVDAFSTLGYFTDPLYSYMKRYSDFRLADLLIHEQTHATVYLSGESQFNEEFANFVGQEGARYYLGKKYGNASTEYKKWEAGEADQAAFLSYLRGLIASLDELYRKPLSREEKLEAKKALIDSSKRAFEAEYASRFSTDSYRWFLRVPVNNAFLSLYQLYGENSDDYLKLYERSGKDLRKFVAAAKTLEKKKGEPKKLLEEALKLR